MRVATLGLLTAGLMLAGCGQTTEQKAATGGLGGAAAGAAVGGPVGAAVGGAAGATGGTVVDEAQQGGESQPVQPQQQPRRRGLY